MTGHEDDYFESVRAANRPWHERVNLEKNTRNELVGVGDAEPADTGPTDPPTGEWQGWEPEPEAGPSREERLANVEGYLAPRAVEAERERQLSQHEALVAQAHDLDPRQLAALVDEATRRAVAERLGVVEQPASMAEILQQGEEIAAAHLGDRWPEVRDDVFEELQARPAWLADVQGNPSPATLGSTFVTVASTLAAADTARSGMAEMKRQAATMSGASARPATQTADEEYWSRIRDAGKVGYGS